MIVVRGKWVVQVVFDGSDALILHVAFPIALVRRPCESDFLDG